MKNDKGSFRSLLAAVLLLVAGVLNIIYGIAAIGNSAFYMHKTHYVFGSLESWGWVALITGTLELVASGSLVAGHRFGRYLGIAVGAVAAIEALLAIPEQPLLSLAVFAISLWIIHGLAIYAGPVEKGGPVDSAEARPSIGPPPMR
jgi:hypothetical protein